jgi:hypothetical protein
MEKKSSKSLYAYFGELGLFDTNIPGHTFYQIGLMDSISEKFGTDQFDFLNYISDKYTSGSIDPEFPSGELGELMTRYSRKLINNYQIAYSEVIEKIKNKEYDKLFLKARFRNLSTLQKKLKDAKIFEDIITTALEVGYAPENIIILDTDLSLSESFLSTIEELGLRREIPSITIPGMSKGFIEDCLKVHENSTEDRYNNLMYYGNLSFDNYKEGHSKNPIINDIIQSVDSTQMFDGTQFTMSVAAKSDLSLENWIGKLNRVALVPREDREFIWEHFSHSIVSVNVSKDLYLEKKFIPARVYESIIFGTIPVSYKWGQHPAMTFETVEDFWEICKFLAECSRKDYLKILRHCADQL